ncbi:proline-rich protein 2-like [Oryx dammah]|uniref:proline-rich protein 2-like n=1 Tax=Oryx dammah TaxID=59534 RepID=UPI001A9ADBEE|nr:proline-rich protein 2-like [Oryx dammah]
MSSSRRVTGNVPAYPCPLQATGNEGEGGQGQRPARGAQARWGKGPRARPSRGESAKGPLQETRLQARPDGGPSGGEGGRTCGAEGAAQRAGDAPRGPGLPCPLSPSPPPRGHPRRPPPPSSGETKGAPPEDPGFPVPSYVCLDGPRARAPQPLGARRRRIPGPRPRPRPGPRLPAGPCAPLRVRAPPSRPSAPRAPSGPPTARAPPSRPDPLGPNASERRRAAVLRGAGARGRPPVLSGARFVQDAPPSCPHPAWPAVNAVRRAYRLRRTQDGGSLPKGTARPALRSGFSRLPGRPPGPPASPQAARGRSGLP